MAWIAVDAGTSIVKAVAFDRTGCEIALARETMEVLHPSPEFAEQSMEIVWRAVLNTIRAVAAELKEPVEGLATTAQGDGCWLVDAEGFPVGNAILWNDGRANTTIEGWRSSGAIDKAFRYSGSVAYAGLQCAIFDWLRKNEPRRLEAARFALSCNGWIFAQLTGRYVADLTDASNPFCDVRRGSYSDDLIEIFGVGKEKRMLPEIAQGGQLVGKLKEGVSDSLGITAGLPVVMAPYDIVSTAYGAGASLPGQACLILGTTICAETITSHLDLKARSAGTTIALGENLHLRAMPTLTGCETLRWAADLLDVSEIADLEALAAKAEGGAGGLIFLPYLSPAGERSPFLDPRAHGSFHGLRLGTAREELARAVYEGLACVIHECLDATGAKVNELKVCGGGARSGLWCQMIADMTGVPVERPSMSELGARGAFLFALSLTGELSSVAEGNTKYPMQMTKFHPSLKAQHRYDAQFRLFQESRDLARRQWALRGMGA